MLIQPYELDELRFACCFRVYYRWRTRRAKSQPALSRLDCETLGRLLKDYRIHVLEATASARKSGSWPACCRKKPLRPAPAR